MVPPKPKEFDFINKPIEVTKTNKRLSFLKQNRSSKGKEETVVHEGDKTKLKEINHVFRNCISALSNNKIGARNAFAVQIIDHLEDLVNLNDDARSEDSNDDFLEEGELDTRFSRASKAIEGATRVYGFRVEAIYDQAFNFMTNMNVPDDKTKDDLEYGEKGENDEDGDDKKNIGDLTPRKLKKRKLDCTLGSSTLAKTADITLDCVQVSNISVDTFFLKVNSTYDHSSALYYLLPNLTLHDDLSLEFDGDVEVCESKKRKRRKDFEARRLNKLNNLLKSKKSSTSFLGKRKRSSSHDSKRSRKRNKEGRHKKKKSSYHYLKEMQKENEQFEIDYKKELYLDKQKLRTFFEDVCEGFEKMEICPEMNYFHEEIEKLKLKKLESKGSKSQEEIEWMNHGEELYDKQREDTDLKEEQKAEVKKEASEDMEGDKKENDKEMEGEDLDRILENKKDGMNDMSASQMNFPDNEMHEFANGDLYNQDMMNQSMMMDPTSEEHNNILNQSNSFNNNDFRIDDLTIENAMQESFSLDQGHHSMANHFQFSQDLASAHHSVNLHGMGLPDLLKSDHNKELPPFMNMGTLRNMNLPGQSMFMKSHSIFSPKKSMFSTVPDEDSLWNRSVLNFETRLNAIDINGSTGYQYYMPNKLMKDGKFRDLIDMNRNALKQKNFGNVANYNAQKKIRAAFDISNIDFYNLYVEVNNNDLSTYDLWKKEKRKYTSNALFAIDQTSYIFEIKENCLVCINSLTDKELRFSKRRASENAEGDDSENYNVVMNDVKPDFFSHDIDINYVEKDAGKYFEDQMEEAPENVFQEEEVVDLAIDKFCNMDIEGVWQNENEESSSEINRKMSMEKVKKELFESEQDNEGALNFETVAKFVDVAKIKKILCDIVVKEEKKEEDTDHKEPDENRIVPYVEESKVTTFSSLINETKAKLGGKEADNASVHMLFVCLLYTCNDQELILQKIPNENDFYVYHGLPLEYHVEPDKSLMMIKDIKK